jgi:hypothetical protein
MNFLNPIYAIAALSIAAPIVLHLVRKQPRNRSDFSSLLFLPESPPRLTRNSRIENWFLLLLRSLMLLMIAFAFSRPYWSDGGSTSAGTDIGKRRCILIDQSASMQRSGVWQSAMQQARDIIRGSIPTDTIAVYGFDRELRPILPLAQARELPLDNRSRSALAAIDPLSPSWSSSDLGAALVACVDALEIDGAETDPDAGSSAEIVILSDFTQGSDIRALEDTEWPQDIAVRAIRALPARPGNASLGFVDSTNASGDYRVRVSNARESLTDSLRLRWIDAEGRGSPDGTIECVVPPGFHRIVKLPPPPPSTIGVELEGDDCPFDNQRFLVMAPPTESIVCVVEEQGLAPEESLAYFLQKIPLDTRTRNVRIKACSPGSDWLSEQSTIPVWVILSHAATLADSEQCCELLAKGSAITYVWDRPADTRGRDGNFLGDTYQKLTNRCAEVDIGRVLEAKVKDFDLWQQLDFRHPILVPLANSQFNDFSRIRFWRHRAIDAFQSSDWQVLAWFSGTQPAVIERAVGKGMFTVMTSGWQPVEGQFALSSKFVPWVAACHARAEPTSIGQTERFAGMDETPTPGIFTIRDERGDDVRIAANVDPRESVTDPMDLSELSRFGVVLASDRPSEPIAAERQRVLIATELESRQAWWWWLVSACLVAVGLESLLCWNQAAAPMVGLTKE